ncbi:MAG TPA: hypothetical protein PLV58_01425 [Campylobacterales bacterium]|nr:hypothetical protein [Campylobacterales bacterium]
MTKKRDTMYGEFYKNFGLGIFVNASYSIMQGDITAKSVLIGLVSLAIMAIGIVLEREERWTDRQ